jgi:hypothetical protein
LLLTDYDAPENVVVGSSLVAHRYAVGHVIDHSQIDRRYDGVLYAGNIRQLRNRVFEE